eukprot:GFKZ01014711.1.p1 GENE.GFKZ01014711.1~~GFKZ01014711.1.p1  ORF type:complete len:282 (-),score=43.36 GFKZ01014711.1:25-750(-)
MGRRSEKIKGRRDAQNAAKTKVFARMGKLITMAVKAGGSDVSTNKPLADAMDAARAASYPKDNVQKAIARATSADQADYKESTFEAYGHGGAAFYIHVLTDNMNRAAADIRVAVNKSKMKIASPGSVAYNFQRKGVVRVLNEGVADADELLLAAIDGGAEECEEDANDDGVYRIVTDPAALNALRGTLQTAGYTVDMSQVEMVPKSIVTVSDADMDRNLDAIDMLNALEDVDGVYTNAVPE